MACTNDKKSCKPEGELQCCKISKRLAGKLAKELAGIPGILAAGHHAGIFLVATPCVKKAILESGHPNAALAKNLRTPGNEEKSCKSCAKFTA